MVRYPSVLCELFDIFSNVRTHLAFKVVPFDFVNSRYRESTRAVTRNRQAYLPVPSADITFSDEIQIKIFILHDFV